MTRVFLLLSCWTLIHLDPVLGSLSRTRAAEHRRHQHHHRLVEAAARAAGGGEGAQVQRRSGGGLTAGARITRIRAGPPLIKLAARTGLVPVNRAVSLGRKEAARSWRVDVHVKAHAPAASRAPPQGAGPAAQRGTGHKPEAHHKQPLVIPHDYMLSLYWSRSSGDLNRSALHEAGLANTITSFVDKGQGKNDAPALSVHLSGKTKNKKTTFQGS